jgi:1,4-alpha-glucan branching enzyme
VANLAHLLRGQHHDPFQFLGQHPLPEGGIVLRVFAPECSSLRLEHGPLLAPIGSGLFEVQLEKPRAPEECCLIVQYHDGSKATWVTPWVFEPTLSDQDLHLIHEGKHNRLWEALGAHPMVHQMVRGTRFSLWAPDAKRISVIGDFNGWDGRRHPMRNRGQSGVWEIFLPGVEPGALYQFEILGCDDRLNRKADPMTRFGELRPGQASIVCKAPEHAWNDQDWMENRRGSDPLKQPLSILEMHAPSWKRPWRDSPPFHTWEELGDQLIPWMQKLGYTHVELLPIMEHPLDDSWGYQVMGFYATSARHGHPDAFRAFVDRLHQAGLGIILDFVPAHFPRDAHGLSHFDGKALYEHSDPMKGEHPDWGTLIFDYGRHEVRNFLIASALYWIRECHVDGFRVDAVASMLYLDYSRQDGEWQPNAHGGRENLDAISFLRELTTRVFAEDQGLLMAAEESTAWPMVTRPPEVGGLGFNLKWNMGWMHDTLSYAKREPIHRRFHHHELSFPMTWAFSENFILPLSHDEVVHGKGSLFTKMPGTKEDKFAGLRLLYAWMWCHPGRKLLFMGSEFGQEREWNFSKDLDWDLLEKPHNQGLIQLISDLNRLLKQEPALHAFEDEPDHFEWLEADDAESSVYAFLRKGADARDDLLVVAGFTPVEHGNYTIGLWQKGCWEVIFNSQASCYSGWEEAPKKTGSPGSILLKTEENAHKMRPHRLSIKVPPLGVVILKPCPSPDS